MHNMAPVQILKFPISSPGDTSPLQTIKEAGYDPSQILAVVGKTEGRIFTGLSSIYELLQ